MNGPTCTETTRTRRTVRRTLGLALVMALLAWAPSVEAHGVADDDRSFVEDNPGAHVGAFLYLGAKHMVTGYDHLLFLVGVIFFLFRTRDVVEYVSLFTLGHSTTLILGVLLDIPADPFLIDAIIGLSVVYKGFDNLDGFRTLWGFTINTKAAVLVFGLFHGLGLATKLREFNLADEGLFVNLIAFNVGVEIGQFLALGAILIGIQYWRTHRSFYQHAFATNTLLMLGGFLLMGYQLVGFFAR